MDLTELAGIGPDTAKKYEKKGIVKVEQLLDIPPPKIAEMLNITNDAANTLCTKAAAKVRKKSKVPMLQVASQVVDNQEIITTGSKQLDKVLGGGLKTSATTEVYGEFGSGKTQFSHTMAVRVQLPKEKGGLDGRAVWIDTEGTFKKKRIIKISEALGLDPNEVLDNIIVARAYNSVDQKNILLEIQNMLIDSEEEKKIRLIIVDSAIGLFRQDFSGRAMLSERQKYLDEFLTLNSNMANNHNLATIWTNQVMTDPGVLFGDTTKPVGGTVLAHKSTYRVYFQKLGKLKGAKMVDSPEDAEIEVNFGLSDCGVVDPDVADKEYKEKKAEYKANKEKAVKGKLETEESEEE